MRKNKKYSEIFFICKYQLLFGRLPSAIMEVSLKEALIIYSERFEEGHPLRDIAITTLKELNRENPFGRSHLSFKPYEIVDIKYGTEYSSLSDACFALGERRAPARRELQRVLAKYDLKMI